MAVPDEVCPGCGLALPATGSAVEPDRLIASAECYELYGEIVARVLADQVTLGRWHQTSLDAYAAQHVGPQTPPITVFFALNTLYLVLDRGFTGQQGRAAHSYLANNFGSDRWPHLAPPIVRAPVTVLDVALAGTAEELATQIQCWGHSVWNAWSHAHDQVRQTTQHLLAGWRPPTGSEGSGASAN